LTTVKTTVKATVEATVKATVEATVKATVEATVKTTASLRQAWVIPDHRASERAPHISCGGPVVIAQTGWAVGTAEPLLLPHGLK
jgi:hypothetical protein